MTTKIKNYTAEWSDWTKKFATVLLFIFGIFALYLFGSIVQDLIIALILAFILFYPSRSLTRWARLPYGVSVGIVFVCYLGIITYLFASFLPPLTNKISEISVDIQQGVEKFIVDLRDYDPSNSNANVKASGYSINTNFILEPLSKLVKGENVDIQQITGVVPSVVNASLNFLKEIPNILSKILIIHFLAILILLDIPRLYKFLKSSISDDYRREYGILMKKASSVWNNFFLAQVLVASIVGILTWIELSALGVPYASIIGLVTAILSIVPILGGLVALLPIGIVPLIQGSNIFDIDNISLTLLVILINVVIQTFVWNLISPKIAGNAVNLPTAVIIISVFAGTAVGGVLGALLAAPIVGIAKIGVYYVIDKIRGGDPFPGEKEPDFMTEGLFREPKSRKVLIKSLQKLL